MAIINAAVRRRRASERPTGVQRPSPELLRHHLGARWTVPAWARSISGCWQWRNSLARAWSSGSTLPRPASGQLRKEDQPRRDPDCLDAVFERALAAPGHLPMRTVISHDGRCLDVLVSWLDDACDRRVGVLVTGAPAPDKGQR
jgi:hypothetical protein